MYSAGHQPTTANTTRWGEDTAHPHSPEAHVPSLSSLPDSARVRVVNVGSQAGHETCSSRLASTTSCDEDDLAGTDALGIWLSSADNGEQSFARAIGYSAVVTVPCDFFFFLRNYHRAAWCVFRVRNHRSAMNLFIFWLPLCGAVVFFVCNSLGAARRVFSCPQIPWCCAFVHFLVATVCMYVCVCR